MTSKDLTAAGVFIISGNFDHRIFKCAQVLDRNGHHIIFLQREGIVRNNARPSEEDSSVGEILTPAEEITQFIK